MSLYDGTQKTFPAARLGGVLTAMLSRSQTAEIYIAHALAKRQAPKLSPLLCTSVNGQTMYETSRSGTVRSLFEQFDLVSIDGQPAVLASRRWKHRFPERVATTDLVHDVIEAGAPHGVRHYFLGGGAEVVERAVASVKRQHPEVQICGWRDGYFDLAELPAVTDEIAAAKAEILWICMGISGLEWMYRAALEPRRLSVRYLASNPVAAALLLRAPEIRTMSLRPH